MYNITHIKSSLTLTQKKRTYSLPKTQPTRSSSSQKIYINNIYKQQVETCPQVAQFIEHKSIDDSFYIHKMNIDYGHIQEPEYWPKKFINAKNVADNNFQRIQLRNIHEIYEKQTERMTPIQKINQLQDTMKSNIVLKLNKSVNASNKRIQQKSDTNKKQKDLLNQNDRQNLKQNEQANLKSLNSSNKKQIKSTSKLESHKKQVFNSNHISNKNLKLKQVLASKLQSQQNSLQSTHNKNCSQQNTQRIQIIKESSQKQQTQRRVPHCRIVKSYVGGNKMQIKIINYPDNSQYVKLVGL